jgi:cytidyltransferase-like protein
MMRKKVLVSGGFDPLHIGHVNMIQAAAELGDVVVVINSDEWLKRKKGYVFMPWQERGGILESLKGVVEVSSVKDEGGSVCEALDRIRPDVFANGGDRTDENIPELDTCQRLGIEAVWGVGGGKIQSSSSLVAASKGE